MTHPVLQVIDLKKQFKVGAIWFGKAARHVHAVDGVSFELYAGETLSIVGESGCGKSTIARTILGLTELTEGEVHLDGARIDQLPRRAFIPLRQRMQVVFQDPFSSLNPKMRVRAILAEPLRNFDLAKSETEIDKRVAELMDMVKLPRDGLSRFPHEFSGGQRQRIGIAKALASRPAVIICDEAVSALDVSVKAQIVNLLQDLQSRLGLALLFISHDLAIVEHMTHRVAVMYLGKIVEIGTKRQIFGAPQHPYTQALLSAVPVPEPGAKRTRILLRGDVPSPINPPSGCHFHNRCIHALDRCSTERPVLRSNEEGHWRACHLDTVPQTGDAP